MKKNIIMGLLMFAIAIIAVGGTTFRQSAELSPPDPKAIVFYK